MRRLVLSPQQRILCAIGLACLTALERAAASGVGLLPFASPLPALDSMPGVRRVVLLNESQGRLIGECLEGVVARVVLEGDACRSARLLIREQRADNGRFSLAFYYDGSPCRRLGPASLWLRVPADQALIYRAPGVKWVRVLPRPAALSIRRDQPSEQLVALTLETLDRLCIGPRPELDRIGALEESARRTPSGALLAGLLHLGGPVLLLILTRKLSRRLHRGALGRHS